MTGALPWKKAHFIGIGGVGMSATAKLLQESGIEITGSDEEVYPPISTFLEQSKLSYKTPYLAENIPADADLIVIGKNAKLIAETNAEVAAAFQSGKTILSFPEVLAALSKEKETIVVAGSYGKSTSAALLSHCLLSAAKDPSYFIGAIPVAMQNAHIGSGGLFVLEGDEYPASNTDPRAKFLLMHPTHALITPLAHDHINVFPTPADYLAPFKELSSLLPQAGTLVICTEGALSKEFIADLGRPAITYGLTHGEYQARDIVWGEKTTFTITKDGKDIVTVETTQLGTHNIQNIVGVAAFVFSKGLVTPEQFVSAVSSFKGLIRRLDKKSEETSIPIYEGFGSSYEKAQSAIAAMKLHFPSKRLRMVFEPNTISWRARARLSQYDDVFLGAAKVYIFNPPHDGKETELSLEEIVSRVSTAGIEAVGCNTAEEVLNLLEADMTAEDCILLSSSGAMGGLVESIPRLAEKKFPK